VKFASIRIKILSWKSCKQPVRKAGEILIQESYSRPW
jgi:hypothetical protein